MASLKQLTLLIEIETGKEQKLQQAYGQAKQHLLKEEQKLASVAQYRTQYMKSLQQQASNGMSGSKLSHFHDFLKKLDKAIEQQIGIVNTARSVVRQRQKLLLDQQKRRKALEILRDKQLTEKQIWLNKQEQKQIDEFATNAFFRQRAANSLV